MSTLLQIRDRAKQETDNVNSSFVSDAEWNNYINSAYYELYGLLVQLYSNDYYVQSPTTGYTFTTDGTNQFFALPADFFKLLGVDVLISGTQYVSLKPFAFGDRNKLSITNSTIPMAGQTIRIFYIPKLTELTIDASTTVNMVNGWEEYIVVDASIRAMAKEESDVSVLMDRKQKLIKRIESEGENRDAGSGQVTVDVYGRRARAMQYRLNGNNLWLIGNSAPGWGPFGDWGNEGGGGDYLW